MPAPIDRRELEDRWAPLRPPPGPVLAGARLPADGGPRSYLAVDSDGARHLLVETTPDATVGPRRPGRGLEVQIRDLAVADTPLQPWFDLQCNEPAGQPAFTALTQDILANLPPDRADTAEAVRAVLTRWRWFWTADPSRLQDGGALGLLGELWFLLHWLGPVTAATLQRWQGPLRDRHDFVSPRVSVEVKTTASSPPGGPAHRITSLQQLEDPETGTLHLFSLQLAADQLAGISLTGLVEQLLATVVSDPAASDLAAERLAATGWTPLHADDYRRTYRVLAEELYEVGAGFPRLTGTSFTSGLPEGITNITYNLGIAACRSWRRAVAAPDPDAGRILAALKATST